MEEYKSVNVDKKPAFNGDNTLLESSTSEIHK